MTDWRNAALTAMGAIAVALASHLWLGVVSDVDQTAGTVEKLAVSVAQLFEITKSQSDTLDRMREKLNF